MQILKIRISLFKLILVFLLVTIITCHYNKHYKNEKYQKITRNRDWIQSSSQRYHKQYKKQTKYDYKDNSQCQAKYKKYPSSKKIVHQKVQELKMTKPVNNKKNQKIKVITENKAIPIAIVQETKTKILQKQPIVEIIQQKQPIQQQTKIIQIPSIKNIQPIVVHPITPQQPITPTIPQNVPVELDCTQRPVYDYNLLVLTWVPQQCYADKDCQKDWQTYEDLRSPTIHTFRPYGSSSYYQACFDQNGDYNCLQNAYMTNFQIDQALWNVTGLLYQISEYWPAQKFTHDQQQFYYQQWAKHGACYLMNMIEDNQNAYKNDKAGFNRTVMIQYFRTAIKKFKQLAIDVQPGTQYTEKQQFALDIGFKGKQTHFVLLCDSNNEIVEIIFCFNRSKLPGKQVTIPCTLDDTCDQTKMFRLKKPF